MRLRPQGPVALVGLAIALLGVGAAAAQDVNLNIGDLPPGKKVVVTFRATVDSLTDQVLPSVDNTGTVDATNLGAPVATNTASTTLDSLTLSDQIFQDNDGSGTFNAGDTGIVGVALTLLQGATPIATTTSLAGGIYAFTGLAPGDYAVRVDASNFAAAAVLDGLSSVLGASDPDNNVDNDDNGVDDASPEVNGITSLPITLAYNTEITPGTGNDSNPTLDFGFVQGPDIEITKAESIDPVIAGSGTGNLVYTITAKNNGPVAATGLAVTETLTLPAGVTVDTAVPSGGTSVSGIVSPITWTIGNLANGAMETLTVTLTVAANAAAGTDVISDTAAVSALNEPDSNPSNDSATEATSIARQANLDVSKTESSDPVVAGSGASNLTYVVTVENLGPSDASGVQLSEDLTLPAGVSVVSITPSAGSFAVTTAPDGTWTVGDLADGASETLTVVLTVDATAAAGTDVIADTATVIAANETDPTPGNNAATVATSISRAVDLKVTKTESADPVTAGSGASNLTYVVTVENLGPSDASGVELTEDLTLPSGVSVVSVTPSGTGAFATTTAPDGTWTVGNLASGASETLTVVLTVAADAAAGTDVIANTAAVSAVTETDADNGNDSATEATSIARQANLDVSKTESSDPVVAGSGASNLTYVVTVENLGPSDASGVQLSENLTLPTGVSVVSVTPSGAGSFATTTAPDGTWTVGDLANGASETLTVVLTVDAIAAAGTDVIADTATVSALNETDPTPGNNTATVATSISRSVDLKVTKTESADPVTAGSGASNLTYVVTVENLGPSDASGVELSEDLTLPSGVSVVSATPSGAGSFATTTAPDGTWTVGDLANGASETLTVVLTVAANAAAGTDVISDTAAVSALNEPDSNSSNNSATEATSIARQANLAVGKAESSDPVVAGSGASNLTYVVTVENLGPSDASGVQLSEDLTLPAGVSVVSVTPSGTGSFATTTAPDGTWTVGDLANGASETLTVVLTVNATAAAGTDVIADTATIIAANETDPTPGNNAATVATSISRQVDLKVTKTESADPVTAGSGASNLTYVVTVENLGPSDASGVQLSENLTLPTGVSVVSVTPSGAGSFATTTAPDGTWTVGDLANGALETLTVVLTAAADAAAGTDVIADTAAVSAVNETDTNSGNDSATEATSVDTEADVEIVAKADGPDPVLAGDQITYTIDYRNNGPSYAQIVEIIDPLPAGTTFVSLTKPVTWSSVTPAVGSNGTVTLSRAVSPPGETATFTLVVAVDPSVAAGTVISNTANVSSDTADPDSTNDAKTTTTLVAAEADLAVTKSDDVDPVAPGPTLTYTVTVDNAGPSDALDVVVTETLPAEVAFVSTSGCTEDPTGVPTCTLGTIAAGASKQYTVTVTVAKPVAAGLTSISNQVDVASSTTDPVAANDTATELTAIDAAPDLAIDKDDDGNSTSPGAVLAYTLTFANNGDQNATGVKVTDTVPANTTFNEAASGGAGVWSCADGAPAGTICEHTVGGLGGTPPVSGGLAGISGQTGGRTTNGKGSTGGPGGPGGLAGGLVTFAVTVDPGVDPGVVTDITNTASIADDGGNGVDPPGDNSDTEVTPLVGDADLEIVLTQSNEKPAGGAVQLYEAKVTNNGPALARDVEATVQLPALSDFLGFTGDATACTVDAANLVTCELGDMNATEMKTTTVGARLDPRTEGDQLVESDVTGTIFADPVPGNESSDVTTSIVRIQRMAAVEFPEGATTRRVLGITLLEGDESVTLGAYDTPTGANLGYHVSGAGQRPVAIAGIDDVSAVTGSGDPAADFAVLSDAFSPLAPVLISVVDADTQDLEGSTAIVGAGDLLPIDLAPLPSFDGSPAADLAVLLEDRVDGMAKVVILDAGSFAVLRGHDVSADISLFPLFLRSIPDLNANLASEVAVAVRDADSNETRVIVLDGDTGATLGDHSFGTGLFPLGLAGPIDGAGPAPELALLVRNPGTGALEAKVFDPATGAVSATKSFDPTMVPGTVEGVDDFGDLPSAEIAVLGRSGTDVKVEIRDADPFGALVSTFAQAMPPATLVPLDMTAVPDFADTPAAELAILTNVFGGGSMVEVVDALSGTPGFSAFLLP